MNFTIIESRHVCGNNEDIELLCLGYKHYKIGIQIYFGIRHKISIRLMLVWWHIMIRLFKINESD